MTPSQPRKLFLSTTERALAGARAKAQGDVEGEVTGLIASGFSEQQARDLVKQKYEKAYRGGGSAASPYAGLTAGELGDGTPAFGRQNKVTGEIEVMDPSTGELVSAMELGGWKPRTTTGSTRSPLDDISMLPQFGGVKYALNTPENRARVDAENQRRILNNPAQIELNKPIGVPAGESQNTDPTRPLRSMGGQTIARPLPQTEADKLAELQNAITMAGELDAVLAASTSGQPTTGLSAKLATLAPNFITEFTGWGTDAKSNNAVIALAKQIIGKSFEGGVLRKEDEVKYADILPTIGDAPAVAASKIALLKKRVQQQLDTHQGTLGAAGFRVGTPPPARTSGAPQLGQIVGNVFDHTKFKVEARTDPKTGQPIYIGIQADGTPVELVFRDGKYFIK